jgi:type II secretory pathway component PulM
MRPFEEERDKVEAGLIATRDLLAWIRANAAEIARLIETH